MAEGQAFGFHEPSQDETYLVFGAEFMGPNILTCDHSTNEWSELYEVGGRFHDSNYHCYPTMVKGPDGRLHVFISRGYISQSTSPGPLQLDGEWHERIMIDSSGGEINGSYPMPVTAADGSGYLFYRGSAPGPFMEPAFYLKSTDKADTWGDPRRAVFYAPPAKTSRTSATSSSSTNPPRITSPSEFSSPGPIPAREPMEKAAKKRCTQGCLLCLLRPSGRPVLRRRRHAARQFHQQRRSRGPLQNLRQRPAHGRTADERQLQGAQTPQRQCRHPYRGQASGRAPAGAAAGATSYAGAGRCFVLRCLRRCRADGWQAQRSVWPVDTQDPRRGVRQSNGVHANNIWMSAAESDWSDYRVSCLMEFRSTSMKFAKNVESGLLARWRDENNHYGFVVWPDEERVSIYKVVDGTRTELATAAYEAPIAREIKIEAILSGGRLLFYVDGEKRLEAVDEAFSAGKIGLRARLIDTLFDEVTVMPHGGGTSVVF